MTEVDAWSNHLSGNSGQSVQVRDIHGSIHLHPAVSPAVPTPRQLRARHRRFVDRDAELRRLVELADNNAEDELALAVVCGLGGVGKTTLAERALHEIGADRFPGGQLRIDLTGWSTTAPGDSLDVLARLLLASGVPPTQVPRDVDAASALWRSITATRPVAVLIDNAPSAGHVQPFLPGAGYVAVTSRHRPAGLILHDATFLTLHPLPREAATRLIAATAGLDANTHHKALVSLAELCDRLPLALKVTAARLTAHPHRPTDRLITDLTDRRLDALNLKEISVKEALKASYDDLPEQTAHAFRILGLHPGPDITTAGAAALLDTDTTTAAQRLDELTDANLLESAGDDRWKFHDLVADLAKELACEHDPAEDQDAALNRLAAHTLCTGAAASYRLQPVLFRIGWAYSAVQDGPTEFASDEDALAWLDDQLDNALALQEEAQRRGRPDVVWMLTEVYWVWCQTRRRIGPWTTLAERAVAAAKEDRNPIAQARMTALLSLVVRERGDYTHARKLSQQVLAISEASGDWISQATGHEQLAALELAADNPQEAIQHLDEGLDVLRRRGYRRRSAALLHRVAGRAYATAGNHSDAAYHFDRALELFAHPDVADTHQQLRTLVERAKAELAADEPTKALATLNRALNNYSNHPRPLSTGEAHLLMAQAHHKRGEADSARRSLDQALGIYRRYAENQNPNYIKARELAEAMRTPESGK